MITEKERELIEKAVRGEISFTPKNKKEESKMKFNVCECGAVKVNYKARCEDCQDVLDANGLDIQEPSIKFIHQRLDIVDKRLSELESRLFELKSLLSCSHCGELK